MKIDIVSVFPEYFEVLNLSLFGKAQAKGLVKVHAHNLRDWTHDVHHSVDDTPVGGGAGMVMKPEVWAECLDDLLGLAPVEVGTDTPATAASSVRNRAIRCIWGSPPLNVPNPFLFLSHCLTAFPTIYSHNRVPSFQKKEKIFLPWRSAFVLGARKRAGSAPL